MGAFQAQELPHAVSPDLTHPCPQPRRVCGTSLPRPAVGRRRQPPQSRQQLGTREGASAEDQRPHHYRSRWQNVSRVRRERGHVYLRQGKCGGRCDPASTNPAHKTDALRPLNADRSRDRWRYRSNCWSHRRPHKAVPCRPGVLPEWNRDWRGWRGGDLRRGRRFAGSGDRRAAGLYSRQRDLCAALSTPCRDSVRTEVR